MERLTFYRQFLQDHDYTHLLNDPERLIYAEIREINGVKVGIGGFNSAWNCCRDNEKGKLWLGGNWQNGTIVNSLNKQKADLKLALIHHPPGWFVEQEDSKMRNQMERDFDFFLHGHEHQGWVNAGIDGHVRIASAACYERADQENGYNFVRLNLETGETEIWLRKFEGDGGGWIPRIIASRTTNDGLWRADSLPCLLKLKTNISSQVTHQNNLLISSEPASSDKSITYPTHKETKAPLSLFYSYAHEDENFRNNLEKHLSNLKRQGVISEWHDRKIIAGQSWAEVIDENLEKADVILLLISSDFIASDFCHEVEMKCALERHEQGLAIVVPILLRDTDLEDSPFAKLQGLPTDFKPIAKWKDQDEAYLDVVKGLRKLIKEMQKKPISTELEKKGLSVKESVVFPAQSDTSFIHKVREELKRILSTRRPAVSALREILLKDQTSNIVPEELLIPAKGIIDPEKAIRFWRKTVKDCLEKRRDLIPEIKRCANDVLGWLVLLVIRENEISRHSGTSLNFSNMAEIIVPVETPTGTGIFVSRLFEKQARLQLKGNLVHCTGWIDPGELESGFFPYDRLGGCPRIRLSNE